LYRSDFEGDDQEHFSPRGRGYSITGKESHIRFGSERKVNPENIIPHIIEAATTTMTRAEKNTIGQAMYRMVVSNPNSSMWDTDIMEPKRKLNADGTASITHVIPSASDDYVLSVKFDGKRKWIKFRKENEYAKRIVTSLKNLEVREQSGLVQAGLKINRFLATVNTSLSPEFVISNLLRDVQAAGYNLSNTEVASMTKSMIRDTASALKGIHHALRDKKGDNKWATYFREFEKAGGRTGGLDPYDTIDNQKKKLQKQLETMEGSHKTRAMFDAVMKYVDDANTAVENAVRLAAFVHARKAGLSEDKAAHIAKELTVNFNRRGEYGVAMNAMYLFYNASVQGTMRMLQALRHKRTRKLVYATVAFAASMDMLQRILGGYDEEKEKYYYDEIELYKKDRNMIFMIPGTEGKYFSLPLPWGYNLFHVMGQEVGSAVASSMGMLPGYEPASSAMRIVGAGVQAFNPVQDGSLLLTASPTVLDPFVKAYSNTDWHGGPLAPEGNPFGRAKPNSQMFFSGASKMSREVANFLNSLSGGDKIRPGSVDESPETLDMLWDTTTGAAGRLVYDAIDTPAKVMSGEDTEMRDWPIARKVFGSVNDQNDKNAYYNRVNDILLVKDQLKYYRNDSAKVKDIRSDYYRETKLMRDAMSADRQLAALRRRKNVAKKRGDTDAVKRLEERSITIMKKFNRRYNQVMY